ncbi:hypothetical protein ABK040_008204 [Willaertia magna]
MSEEEEIEIVDIRHELSNSCKQSRCKPEVQDYEGCVKRIEGDETGEKNCMLWAMDLRTCVDNCVSETIFARLK